MFPPIDSQIILKHICVKGLVCVPNFNAFSYKLGDAVSYGYSTGLFGEPSKLFSAARTPFHMPISTSLWPAFAIFCLFYYNHPSEY